MARKYGRDNTHLTLTEKAKRGYNESSELAIYEDYTLVEDDDNECFSLDTVYRYQICECGIKTRWMTEAEVNEYLEDTLYE